MASPDPETTAFAEVRWDDDAQHLNLCWTSSSLTWWAPQFKAINLSTFIDWRSRAQLVACRLMPLLLGIHPAACLLWDEHVGDECMTVTCIDLVSAVSVSASTWRHGGHMVYKAGREGFLMVRDVLKAEVLRFQIEEMVA